MSFTLVGSVAVDGDGTNNTTIDLSSMSIQEGDLILVFVSTSALGATYVYPLEMNYRNLGGYSYSSDAWDFFTYVFWKLVYDTIDTSITITVSNDSQTILVYIIRGADPDFPITVTPTSFSGVNGTAPNPPSITSDHDGSLCIIYGGMPIATNIPSGDPSPPSGFTDMAYKYNNGTTYGVQTAIAIKSDLVTGAFDPAAWSGFYTNGFCSVGALSILINPAPSSHFGSWSILGYKEGVDTENNTITIDFSEWSLQVNDLIIAICANGHTSDVDTPPSESGYTQIVDLYRGDEADRINLEVYWKKMGSTPDSEVNVPGAGTSTIGHSVIVYAIRGASSIPFVVTPGTFTYYNAAAPNPPSITPNVLNSLALAGGAVSLGTSGYAGPPYGPAGLAKNIVSIKSGITDGIIQAAGCRRLSTLDAYDCGAFTGLGGPGTANSAGFIILIEPSADLTDLCVALDQIYFISGSHLAVLMDQVYHITDRFISILDQNYSLRMLAVLVEYYGDVPQVKQFLDQYYGSADLLKRLLSQNYGDARKLTQLVDEEWIVNAGLLAIMDQNYSISESQYIALANQIYNIKDTELIQKLLDQVYVLQPSGIALQNPIVSVTASATSLFPEKVLHPYHIEIEVDEEEFAIKGEIHLPDEAEWTHCVHIETELTIPIDGTEYHLLVEGPWRSRQPGLTEYYVPMASKTILLDAPYADGLEEEELGGKMASVIAQELATIGGITVDWEMIDWFIPVGALYANGETPLAVIRKIVSAAGGVLQSSPAGHLICRSEYPDSVPNWQTASPDFYLTDGDNFLSVSSKPDIRDGFNRFSISDQDEGTQGLTLEEVTINSTTKHILVYQVPFVVEDVIRLLTSGGSWVSIVAEGVVEETIEDEQVEIVGGEGNTSKPIYSRTSHAYKQTVLGGVTFSESGGLTTEILENSLMDITYVTKYRKFIVTDPNIEDVQFFPEIVP